MEENIIKSKKSIKISLASSKQIIENSYGEISKPATINYKTLKPEPDGLFCERVFGPIKNFRCYCGKYKKINNKGKICEVCGVEITESIVRRERMGHISLQSPIAHIWMFKVIPSRISIILNMNPKEIENILYFVSFVVIDPGESKLLRKKQVLEIGESKKINTRFILKKLIKDIIDKLDQTSFSFKRATMMYEDLEDETLPFSFFEYQNFIEKHTKAKFGIGAEAIKLLLSEINLKAEIFKLKNDLNNEKIIKNQRSEKIKILNLYSDLLASKSRPEWMIMDVIPVLPAGIRPIIKLDGGRFTTSEINDLYRKIIIRNNRLRRIKELNAPLGIIINEKRMLQEAVDALFDNDRKFRPVTSKNNRVLKSLTANLKGKKGRFRQNLLGKRVDYSGRSVIVVGPKLKMYQCGLPQEMAIVLFKPFIIAKLIEYKLANNIKYAEKLIDARKKEVWSILEEVIKTRPVILNRAPTLHRLGIQAFEPILVSGKAIQLHPLVTTAFNADFDGDQMAVHLPITNEAINEARALMLGSRNILGPKDSKPIAIPSQDIILGNYYLTVEKKEKQSNYFYASFENCIKAYENNIISLHGLVIIPVASIKNKTFDDEQQNGYLITTPGKILFNQSFKNKFPYLNSPNDIYETSYKNCIFYDSKNYLTNLKKYKIVAPFKGSDLNKIIGYYFKKHGANQTAKLLDNLKNLGFKYSTKSGITISAADIKTYQQKYKLFEQTHLKIQKIENYFAQGYLTKQERHTLIIETWSSVKATIEKKLNLILKKQKNNSIYLMSDSGARGNLSNFTQLVGMRGLMNNPKGEIIELPILSSFSEGLNVREFFISTHGARKGMADIALKTADSGYLTRRLVDVSQEVVVCAIECNTKKGFIVSSILDTKYNSVIVPIEDRLLGRNLLNDLKIDANKTILKNVPLTSEDVALILKNKISKVEIRSVLTCNLEKGVCVKCYGLDLTTGKEVAIGSPVGVTAAQSIGEPGTQLTMRTFHTGGVAGGVDITQGLPRIKELLDVTKPKGTIASISKIDGFIVEIKSKRSYFIIKIKNDIEEIEIKTAHNAKLRVKEHQFVKRGQKLSDGAINIKDLMAVADIVDVQRYILKEVQRVYRLQGIEISDKYIEIIIKQMLSHVYIEDGGESNLLPKQIININKARKIILQCFKENKKPPIYHQIILGVKKAPLESDSFLASASFQHTTRVLVKAIIKGRVDYLNGLKENVMLGNLIPAGTGLIDPNEILQQGKQALKNEY